MINLGILTSSRADFGIYQSLLQNLNKNNDIHFELIVFGTHLSKLHGYTYDEIKSFGFKSKYFINIETFDEDNQDSISYYFSKYCIEFSEFWKLNRINFDYVMCLGDRFEMAASVVSAIPFGIKFIHLHGGETSLGAIDNVYRDIISSSSLIHFVSTEKFKIRLNNLLNNNSNIYNVGSLSLENVLDINYISLNELSNYCNLDLSQKFILCTVHPETVSPENNLIHIEK